jgi:hypothetical protein
LAYKRTSAKPIISADVSGSMLGLPVGIAPRRGQVHTLDRRDHRRRDPTVVFDEARPAVMAIRMTNNHRSALVPMGIAPSDPAGSERQFQLRLTDRRQF